ncbi:MAG: SRPBCC domain-containing protein, partial [Gaiellaceae bacterium]
MRIELRDGRRYSRTSRGVEWDEAVVAADPPRWLVHDWVSYYDPEMAAEEPSRVTWEIAQQDDGTCLLTLVHDRLEGAPKTAAGVAGPGWMYVLSGLKTLVETG